MGAYGSGGKWCQRDQQRRDGQGPWGVDHYTVGAWEPWLGAVRSRHSCWRFCLAGLCPAPHRAQLLVGRSLFLYHRIFILLSRSGGWIDSKWNNLRSQNWGQFICKLLGLKWSSFLGEKLSVHLPCPRVLPFTTLIFSLLNLHMLLNSSLRCRYIQSYNIYLH